MKKTLLFAIAFTGAITFTSAQNEATTTDDLDTQEFSVGNNGELNDSDSMVSIIAGTTGTVTTNNSYFGITSDAIGDAAPYSSTDDIQGFFTFTAKTTSANLNTNITLTLRKRKGNTLNGTVDLDGSEVLTITDESTGETTNSFEYIDVVLSDVELTSTPRTITLNVNSLLRATLIDQASPPTLRLYNVTIEKNAVLGVEDFNIANNIGLYPNPVANSFQIDSSINIENVQVYNVTGQLLKTFNQEANYDISDLATGIYIANIKTSSGSKTIKITKQ